MSFLRTSSGLASALGFVLLLGSARPASVIPAPLRAQPNDNRHAAGVMQGDTLVLRLEVQRAEWYPEADSGPHITIEAFGEEGKPPSIPAPLIRVATGTPVRVMVRNRLGDSTVHVVGLGTHPVPATDTLHVAPGGSREVRFTAGAPGTYLYHAVTGNDPDGRPSERETANGAFVVDPPGGAAPDRIFVINVISYDLDSLRMRQAVGFNGRSWPYTERLAQTVGDSVHWRLLNGSTRGHPIHLHGFYFQLEQTGNGISSRAIPEAERRLQVTEQFAPWQTRTLAWFPDRPGNWLLHCHLTVHVSPEVRLDNRESEEHQAHSGLAAEHMAGLVLGITVAPRPGDTTPPRGTARRLDLYAGQGPGRGPVTMPYGYVLQRGSRPPAPDSLENPSSMLVVTRGEPTDIVVHNRSRESTGIHWHGIELESWSDGVAGWSNRGSAVAPAIAPGDSFVAHLSLPRAGTFMYHTHLNDIKQVTGGAAGPLIVLEPGETFDPARDHVYLAAWNGRKSGNVKPPDLIVNGTVERGADAPLAAAVSHRFRFINIGVALNLRFELRLDTTLVAWTARAQDGAALPAGLQRSRPAVQVVAVGQTFDFDLTLIPGDYVLRAEFIPPPGLPATGPLGRWRQRLIVR